MSQLSDSQIRQIIQKATLLQKFSDNSSAESDRSVLPEDLSTLYEIADSLGLKHRFVHEAYVESTGIPIRDAIIVDTQSFNKAEAVGYAKGEVDASLLQELKAQAEYHFNTVGKITHRRDKVVWKAKPSGISRFIASSNTPEIHFKESEGGTEIRVHQSLKTINKFFLPGIFFSLVGFMMMASVVMGTAGPDGGPLSFVGAGFLIASFVYSRFINGKRNRRKQQLCELAETLQHSIERRVRSDASFEETKQQEQESSNERIRIPEEETHDKEQNNDPGLQNELRDSS